MNIKKIFYLTLLIAISGCGYHPLYTTNNEMSFSINQIIQSGDENINRKIINRINTTKGENVSYDLIINSKENNHVLFGYGYGDIIPAMDDPQRKGEDGTNENVHNFLLNIFARGGLFHLLIYTFIIYEIFKSPKIVKNQSLILLLIVPIFVVSFFDASMENPHFPLIFYFFLGRLTNELKL